MMKKDDEITYRRILWWATFLKVLAHFRKHLWYLVTPHRHVTPIYRYTFHPPIRVEMVVLKSKPDEPEAE